MTGLQIVYGVGELTAQPPDPIRSVFLEEREKHLSVAVATERIRQSRAQLAVIQNLPVEDKVNTPAHVRHRLTRTRQIDDRQPGMGKSDSTFRPHPGVVGTAMNQRPGHIHKQFAVHRFTVESANPYYSAHSASRRMVNMVRFPSEE